MDECCAHLPAHTVCDLYSDKLDDVLKAQRTFPPPGGPQVAILAKDEVMFLGLVVEVDATMRAEHARILPSAAEHVECEDVAVTEQPRSPAADSGACAFGCSSEKAGAGPWSSSITSMQ
jgi:hypothetical protein